MKILPYLLLIIVLMAVFFLACYPIESSNDVWWHLKTGKYLLEKELFPKHDVFSLSGAELDWANHEWLSDIAIWLCYKGLGFKGLVLLKSFWIVAIFLLVFWLCYRKSRQIYVAVFFTLLAGLAAQYTLYLRPPLFSYMGVAVLMHLIHNISINKNRPLSILGIAVLMALWINLHGGAILGPVILGLYACGYFVETLCKPCDEAVSKQNWLLTKLFIGVTILAALATLLNPYGYHIHMLTYKIMSDKSLVGIIGELQAPDFHHTRGYEIMILGGLMLGWFASKRPKIGELLVLLFFLHQSLNHVRHLPLFGIIAAPILSEQYGNLYESLKEKGNRLWIVPSSQFLIIIFAFATLVGGFSSINKQVKIDFIRFLKSEGVIYEAYPVETADFIKYMKLPGQMYNPINFAGYLIWALSPETTKVLTDSRFDIHGSECVIRVMSVEEANQKPVYLLPRYFTKERFESMSNEELAKPFWRWVLDHYNINYIVTGMGSRLSLYLRENNKGWIRIFQQMPAKVGYRDYGGYEIYIRDIPENNPWIERAKKMAVGNRLMGNAN